MNVTSGAGVGSNPTRKSDFFSYVRFSLQSLWVRFKFCSLIEFPGIESNHDDFSYVGNSNPTSSNGETSISFQDKMDQDCDGLDEKIAQKIRLSQSDCDAVVGSPTLDKPLHPFAHIRDSQDISVGCVTEEPLLKYDVSEVKKYVINFLLRRSVLRVVKLIFAALRMNNSAANAAPSDLTGPGIEPQISRNDVLTAELTGR